MTAYSLFGFPLPEADVRAVDDGVTVMQDDGEPVTRFRTEQVKRPRRCWCGRGVSWNGIECAEHDDPPGIPARFDERYDPGPEPIDRSIQ